MRHPDFVVTGTGRSGTSFVAYVLAKRFGVCMGHVIDKKPDGEGVHRWGSWEDNEIKIHTRQLTCRRASAESWLEAFTRIHSRKQCSGLVGMKHPDMAFVDLEDWHVIQPRHIIWAYRDPELVERSKRRVGNPFGPWRTRKALWYLERLYEDPLFSVLRLDFSEERSVDEIEQKIRALDF